MSRFDTTSPELQSLLLAACSEEATQSQLAQLEELVDTESTMQLVIDYLQLDGELHRIICQQSSEDKCLEIFEAGVPSDRRAREQLGPVPPITSLPSSTIHWTAFCFSSGWPVAYLVATVLLGVGLLIGTLVHVSEPAQVARPSVPLPSPLSPLPSFVGRITGMVDCEWSDPHTAVPGPVAVPLGRKYALASGLMEITYNTGAKVVLQGPCTYEVESVAGGFLSLGKLTARVNKKEERRTKNEELPDSRSSFLIPHSYFAVRTPTATVTDLGTEFGVEVGEKGLTTSHVYRGSVSLQAAGGDKETSVAPLVLYENESARVERSGGTCVVVRTPSTKPATFVRKLVRPTIKTFDLVDVVAGGDGFSGKRNGGIDPTTGEATDTPPVPKDNLFWLTGDGQYHLVNALPFVDGVFIPSGRVGPVQVDSAGHTFDGFFDSDGTTSGYVWAGGAIPASAPIVVQTELDGVDYATAGHGLLFLHANKGITFDLETIRRTNPGCNIVRFLATAGNTEVGSEKGLPVFADLWVLVDGHASLRRREINRYSGAIPINISLNSHARFLTLVATDGGNGVAGDWILFGDPRLELSSTGSTLQKRQ